MFARANPADGDVLETCSREFARADTDGSGTLSHREFDELIKRLTGEAASARMLKKLLRMVDIDQSGKVEVDEFLKFAAPTDLREDLQQLERRVSELAVARKEGTAGLDAERSRMAERPTSPPATGAHSSFASAKVLTGAKGVRRGPSAGREPGLAVV